MEDIEHFYVVLQAYLKLHPFQGAEIRYLKTSSAHEVQIDCGVGIYISAKKFWPDTGSTRARLLLRTREMIMGNIDQINQHRKAVKWAIECWIACKDLPAKEAA